MKILARYYQAIFQIKKGPLLGRSLMLGVFVLFLAGCGKIENLDPKQYYEKMYRISEFPDQIKNPADQINLLCWNDYFPEELFIVFEKIYGTKVHVEYFENNEELRDKYEANPEKWDILMPSDYMVRQFIREGFLKPVDREKLPKMEELNPVMFQLECDPGLDYFIPIYHSCLGLSFEVLHMSGFPRHWDYWDNHEDNPYIYSRVALPNQMRVVFALALLRLNLDPNTKNPEDIKKAEDYLVSFIQKFGVSIVGDELSDSELLKEYLLILTWNGTGAYYLSQDSNYRFLIPEDKTIFAVDGFVITKDTKHLETCYLFIDYVMTAEVIALLSNYSFYAPASLMAERYVNSFILNGPSILIPKKSNRVSLQDVGNADVYYREAWERVKSAKPDEDLTIIPLQDY